MARCIDACRAQSVADATYSLERELASLKLAWAAELGSAARSDKSRYGHVAVPLSSIRACCVELLLDDAMQRSTPFPAPLSVCPGRSRSTSMASGTAHVLRARASVMADFLGSRSWLSQDTIVGNAKRAVVVDR